MLPNTIALTSPQTCTLTKRSEQNGTTKYTGEYTSGSPATLKEVIVEVKHTRPSDPTSKSSSLCKTTIHAYDENSILVNTFRSWTVVDTTKFTSAGADNVIAFNEAVIADSGFHDEFIGGSY